jgi:hypothetical protein
MIALHELHIPLLMYYAQCIRLGRDSSVEVRREAFDLWLHVLAPLMVVTITKLGSHEYGKGILQFTGKVLWLKENVPAAFDFMRDNFGLVLDSEPIELVHSWVANNVKSVKLASSDSDQVCDAFYGKHTIQKIKFGVAKILGMSASSSSRGGVNVTADAFLKVSYRKPQRGMFAFNILHS